MAGTQTSLRSYWGLAKETVKGTPVAPTTFPRWLDGSKLSPKISSERVLEGDGSRDGAFTLKKMQEWTPVIATYPRPIEAGQLIAAAMGTASDTKTGAGPYTHTIIPANTPDYFSLEQGLSTGDFVNRVTDSLVTELVIEMTNGQPVKFQETWEGITGVRQSSAASVTVEAGLPMLFTGGTFSVDGSGSTFVEKAKLTFKNVVDKPQTGALTAADLIWGRRTLDVEYTLLFQSDALFRKMFYGGASGTTDALPVGNGALDFTFLQGGLVTSGYSMELQVPSMDYIGNEPEPKLDGKAFRYDAKAMAIHGGSALWTAIVINTQSTAY